MIRSGWGSALPRRLVLVAAAALIPVLAGCEAGNKAPTLGVPLPDRRRGHRRRRHLDQERLRAGRAARPRPAPRAQSASLFLALVNNGAPDRLLSITAPGSATSVTLPGGSVPVTIGHPVLLTGPQAAARPRRPAPGTIAGGSTVTARADVPEGRAGHADGAGHATGRALRDIRAAAASASVARRNAADSRPRRHSRVDAAARSRDRGADRPSPVGQRSTAARGS